MIDIIYDTFYRYEELVAFLDEAKNNYPDLINVKSLTKTPEGRDVFLAEITDNSTGSCESKCAYYIQANVHAQESAGTTAALHVIKTILTDNSYRDLLKKIAFYIIPSFNPDGAEYTLTTRGEIRSRNKYVKCKNGLVPQDINGDGYILSMRWKDTAGPMKEDQIDPRLMVRREDGDTEGTFYRVAQEGLIEDYDGTGICEGIRSIDFNRNWPINWKPGPGASEYPLEEPEMRAVADFLVSHRNIFAGIDFHCGNNGILRPSMIPDAQMNLDDLEQIINIGKKACEDTGFPLIHESDYKESWKQPSILHGNSNDWAYFALGISHYVIELGNGFNNCGIPTREYLEANWRTRDSTLMRRVLEYHDANGSKLFVPWEKYEHPQLGEVEIGGLMKGNAYFMYPPAMEKVYPGTTAFILRHAEMHPQLVISNVQTENMGEQLFKIRATISNIGGFSTNVMNGGSQNVKQPVSVVLTVNEDALILSSTSTNELNELRAYGSCAYVEWLVKAPECSRLTIRAYHPKAGYAVAEVHLGRN